MEHMGGDLQLNTFESTPLHAPFLDQIPALRNFLISGGALF